MQVISHLYDNYADARAAVQELERAGVPHSDISIVANNTDGWYANRGSDRIIDRDGDGEDDRTEATETGAGVGAAVGGGAGLLAGLGIMAIPGLGPVVAAGWLAATAAGAIAGGLAGGLIGRLTEAGVSEEDAHLYAEGVRRGGALVTAKVSDGDVTRLKALMSNSAVDVESRREAYRSSGWNQFDPDAPPYTSDQVRAERDRWASTV